VPRARYFPKICLSFRKSLEQPQNHSDSCSVLTCNSFPRAKAASDEALHSPSASVKVKRPRHIHTCIVCTVTTSEDNSVLEKVLRKFHRNKYRIEWSGIEPRTSWKEGNALATGMSRKHSSHSKHSKKNAAYLRLRWWAKHESLKFPIKVKEILTYFT